MEDFNFYIWITVIITVFMTIMLRLLIKTIWEEFVDYIKKLVEEEVDKNKINILRRK